MLVSGFLDLEIQGFEISSSSNNNSGNSDSNRKSHTHIETDSYNSSTENHHERLAVRGLHNLRLRRFIVEAPKSCNPNPNH